MNEPYVKCTGCGTHAEMLDRDHPEFFQFCVASGVDPDKMGVVFRRVCECTDDLVVVYPASLN